MSPNLLDELREAAKQRYDATRRRNEQTSKARSFAFLALFVAFAAGAVFAALYMNFKSEKAFDLRALARATPQQAEFVQRAMFAPHALDPDHCFITPSIFCQRAGGEGWFFGARLRDAGASAPGASAAAADWFLCLLLGPKDDPVDIRAFGLQVSSYHAGEPMYSEGENHGVRASIRNGSQNVSRLLKGAFDHPDRRPKGLFWRMAGLGPGAEWP